MATKIHEDHNGLIVYADGSPNSPCWGRDYTAESAGDVIDDIYFQDGPVPEKGVNGLTNEALIAVLIHRLGVLNDRFPCEQNELAIGNLRTALAVLEDRTADRVARGVEGKEEA